jgi:DNA repair exonuclease SbcCD ATPase subunit
VSTNKRKEKRLKEELHAGRQAQEELARIKATNGTDKMALARAMDDLVELQDKYNELEASWAKASAQASARAHANRILEQDNEQLMEANTKLREEVQKLQREHRELQKENANLRSADKDSGKLRRRLREAKEQLAAAQTQINKMKLEARASDLC